jgi:hypothetical protein
VILTVNVGQDFGRNTTENFKFLTGLFEFLDDTRSSATVFIQSSAAETLSDLAFPKSAEIASGGDSGRNLTILTENEIADEITNSKKCLQAIFRTKVQGFRAPFFMPPANLWKALEATGYAYSSSMFQKDVHGKLPQDGVIYRDGVKEIPIQKMIILPVHFGLPSYRLLYPLSKLFVPRRPRIFYYSTAELSDIFPGQNEGLLSRIVLSINRGRRARRLLYPILNKFAPTVSISEFLKNCAPPPVIQPEPQADPRTEPEEKPQVEPPAEPPAKSPKNP